LGFALLFNTGIWEWWQPGLGVTGLRVDKLIDKLGRLDSVEVQDLQCLYGHSHGSGLTTAVAAGAGQTLDPIGTSVNYRFI